MFSFGGDLDRATYFANLIFFCQILKNALRFLNLIQTFAQSKDFDKKTTSFFLNKKMSKMQKKLTPKIE